MNFAWALLIMLFGVPTFAQVKNQDCADCTALPAKAFGPQREWGASVELIQGSPCVRLNPYTEAEMKQWIEQNRKTPDGKEDPRLKEAFQLLLGPFKPPKSECKTTLCATQDIFGDKQGLQLLYLLERYGINGSHYNRVSKLSDPWTASELDEVILGLAAFPENTVNGKRSTPLVRFKRGKLFQDPVTKESDSARVALRNGDYLYFFDHWNQLDSKEERIYTVTHELGHLLSEWNGNYQDSTAWKDISGWKGKDKDWKVSNPEKVISKYGKEAPAEDFAESVSAYRFNSRELKARSPEKYKYMKNVVFDGVEYLDDTTCKTESVKSVQFKKKFTEIAKTYAISNEFEARAEQICSSTIIAKLGDEAALRLGKDSDLRACIQQLIKSDIADQAYQQLYGAGALSVQAKAITQSMDASIIPEKNIRQIVKKTNDDLVDAMREGVKLYHQNTEQDNYGHCNLRRDVGYLDVREEYPQFNQRFGDQALERMNAPIGKFLEKVCGEIVMPEMTRFQKLKSKTGLTKPPAADDEQVDAIIAKYLSVE